MVFLELIPDNFQMKKHLLITLVISIFFNCANGQIVNWKQNFGGSSLDEGYQIVEAGADGYYLLGVVNSSDYDGLGNHGNADILVVKTDLNGNKIWSKCVGGFREDFPYRMIQCQNGNLIVVGITNSIDGDFVGGNLNVEGVIVKMDTSGNILQTKFTNGNAGDGIYDIIEEPNGNFVAVGETESSNMPNHQDAWDFYLVKYDSNLNVIWQTNFGGYGDETATRIIPYKNGYLLGGVTNSINGQVTGLHGGFKDIWIIRADSAGNFITGKCFGGTDIDSFTDFVLEDSLDVIVVLGGTYSNNGNVSGNHMDQFQMYNSDIWICRIDSNLNFLNQKCIGGTDYDRGLKILPRYSNYLILAETRSSDGDIPCTQSGVNGAIVSVLNHVNQGILFHYCFGDAGDEVGNDFKILGDSALAIVGSTTSLGGTFISSNYGDVDIFFDKIDNGIIDAISNYPGSSFTAFVHNNQIYCNGLNQQKVGLSIYDITGRLIFTRDVSVDQGLVDVDLEVLCYYSATFILTLSTLDGIKRIKYISGL
jgi:hypothetical protein